MEHQASKSDKAGNEPRRTRRVSAWEVPATNLTLTFRHIEPTGALKSFANRKFARMTKSLKRSFDVHLILTVDKYRQAGEVTVKSGRFLAFAQKTSKDLYSVLDGLADKIERQSKDHLAKVATSRVCSISTAEVMTEA